MTDGQRCCGSGTEVMNPPLITIGITAYNAAATVGRAVASALAQQWRPLEIVIVDDCSTDGTYALLEDLAQRHPEMRLFRNPGNLGVAATRNRILAEARGEFIAFFDDDDESLPHRLPAQADRILAYEREFAAGAPVICHTARRLSYPDGSQRIEATMGSNPKVRAPSGRALAERILLGTPLSDAYGACPTCCQMARRETYRQLGGFDPALRRSEDTDFNIRLALEGGHFVGIDQPLVLQTVTKTSEKSLAEEYRNMLLVIRKHRSVAEQAGQYSFCLKWIEGKQAWLTHDFSGFARTMAYLLSAHPLLTVRRLALALRHVGGNHKQASLYSEDSGG